MRIFRVLTALLLAAPLLAGSSRPAGVSVGPDGHGGYVVSTLQTVHPAGDVITFPGRPVDLALDTTHHRLYVKESHSLIVIDADTETILQTLPYPDGLGASMHGILRSGDTVWITTAQNALLKAVIDKAGVASWGESIALPGLNGAGPACACGIAYWRNSGHLAVCLSMANSLALVDPVEGKVDAVIPVGIAPYDVAVNQLNGNAYVSDWGGAQPKRAETSAISAGTPVRIDSRGVANDGCVSIVDLNSRKETSRIKTGLHPSGLALTVDGTQLYVANANSDTISKIDIESKSVEDTISVHPFPDLPFGSAPGALALSRNNALLFAANGGSNSIAVIMPSKTLIHSDPLLGLIPTGWYPGAVVCDDSAIVYTKLFIASVKGLGSRQPGSDPGRWNVRQSLGCVNVVRVPRVAPLSTYTKQVIDDSRMLLSRDTDVKRRIAIAPTAIPARTGEPSVFKHVVYILKENRSYDQLFGDIKEGNGDPRLVMYGEHVTPNHHALARQFVLLDNYYCNGTISADGHSWATEGNCTDHLEKSFGGFVRSYTFGDDPLTYSSSGFLWDKVLEAGLTFRNYGEMDYAEPVPKSAGFKEIYADFLAKGKKITFTHSVGIENLKKHTMPDYPGWNLHIPDVVRADVFLKDLKRTNDLAALTIIYLPNDHTSGTSPGSPTPRAQVADNDLALGRIVDGISHSRFWPQTCIFVNEDDPQDGYDHVDGHRSICLVISPYTRRHMTISAAYNQTSALHTMERILGLAPMNQFDDESPIMDACFTSKLDPTPYNCLTNEIPLDEMNPLPKKLSGLQKTYARQSAAMNWAKPDAIDDDALNRILWFSARSQ
jgi:YVTN family beta-propeller protein